MNSTIARSCLLVSIIASTFGVLMQVFVFGRALLGPLETPGLILLVCFALLPVFFLAAAFRRWNGILFIAGNAAMFVSAWCIVLFFPNMGLPDYADIGLPLGIFLGGAVLLVGTGLQYCGREWQMIPQSGLRATLIVLGSIICVVFFPFLKIAFGFTAYFAASCIFSSINLLLFGLAGGILSESSSRVVISAFPPSPGKKGIGGAATLFVMVVALLVAQVTYYFGQDTMYAAERTVFIWPFAVVAAAACVLVRKFTTKNFWPFVAPSTALLCVLMVLAGTPFAYGWVHAALVGSTYAFALISYVEDMPRWSPSNPRGVGPFSAMVGLFTVLCVALVGYVGGIPIHTEELQPILNLLPYFCGSILLGGLLQIYCVHKIAKKVEHT